MPTSLDDVTLSGCSSCCHASEATIAYPFDEGFAINGIGMHPPKSSLVLEIIEPLSSDLLFSFLPVKTLFVSLSLLYSHSFVHPIIYGVLPASVSPLSVAIDRASFL